MSVTMEDGTKRWSANCKSALVDEIIQSETTVSDAARSSDLAPSGIAPQVAGMSVDQVARRCDVIAGVVLALPTDRRFADTAGLEKAAYVPPVNDSGVQCGTRHESAGSGHRMRAPRRRSPPLRRDRRRARRGSRRAGPDPAPGAGAQPRTLPGSSCWQARDAGAPSLARRRDPPAGR